LIYRLVFNLLLRRIDAEAAHELAANTLRAAIAVPPLRAIVRRLALPRDPSIEVRAFGLTFPSPLGVAAGLDKDATWFEALGAIGFGFVEVGTITAHPQPGNPPPRVLRLPSDRALLNRMGFPNPGAEAVGERLRGRAGRAGRVAVGVNVGKGAPVALADANEDYRATVRRLAPFSDYLAINVSSPNTPGLRDMQALERLRPLIVAVQEELRALGVDVPVLVKVSPDASDAELDAIADLAIELSLAGIIAVNTTVHRHHLTAAARELAARIEGGGVSGAPLGERALEVLRRLRARVGDGLVLVSVGGIADPDDAWERILAGATLVQAYTGFVYAGPTWPHRMNRALAQRVRAAGASSIQELVGSAGGGAQIADR
jgi:dihydroorotate dehydrogenase